MNSTRVVALVGFCLLARDAGATVYRCDLPGGKVEYQQLPCTNGKARTLSAPDQPDSVAGAASTPRNGAVEPEIVGSSSFREQVKKALDLLKLRAPSAYTIALTYVGRIEQAPHSGMRADTNPPTFLMSDATAMYSVTWAAATIAHDSYHSKLYYDYQATHPGDVPANVWNGIQAEVKCMTHQLTVMQLIGSSRLELNHATVNADGHYTKNGETKEERDLKPY
jgi:hypothetical protein